MCSTSSLNHPTALVLKIEKSAMDLNNSQITESGQRLSSRLPTELLSLIVALVDEKNAFVALCGTSTILRALALPFMFGTVNLLEPRDRDRQERLVKTLQHLQTALFVKEFRIEMSPLTSCHPYSPVSSCSRCNSLDESVGVALVAMVNLELLQLGCSMCPGTLVARHTYIDKLATRTLRTFRFECICSRMLSMDQPAKEMELLYLATVHSFSYRHILPNGPAILEHSDIMPLVRNMHYHGTSQDHWILTTRPIERLQSTPGSRPKLVLGINQSPGKLTHLVLGLLIAPVLRRIPRACAHLQHIGTLRPHVGIEAILILLSGCPPMKNVTSIDAAIYKGHLPYWDEEACSKIRTVLPSLRKVLLHDAIYAVWELQGETWSMRTVSKFTPWDIIRGACDDL